jgi:hypothetical protein
MPIIGLNKAETEEIYLPEDESTPAEERTYFLIGALDVDVRNSCMDRLQVQELTKDGAFRAVTRGLEINTDLCRAGIRGWRNFRNENNAEIPFRQVVGVIHGRQLMVVDDECMATLPPHVVNFLGQEIMGRNTATKATQKKLKQLLSPPNSTETNSTASGASQTGDKPNEDAPAPGHSNGGQT